MAQTLREEIQEDIEKFPYRVWVNVTFFIYKAQDSDALVRKIHTTVPLPLSEEYMHSFGVAKDHGYFEADEDALASMAAEIVEWWDTDILTRLAWQPDLVGALRKWRVMFPHCSVFAQVNKIGELTV